MWLSHGDLGAKRKPDWRQYDYRRRRQPAVRRRGGAYGSKPEGARRGDLRDYRAERRWQDVAAELHKRLLPAYQWQRGSGGRRQVNYFGFVGGAFRSSPYISEFGSLQRTFYRRKSVAESKPEDEDKPASSCNVCRRGAARGNRTPCGC